MDDLTISVNSILVSEDDDSLLSTQSGSSIHPRLDFYKKKTNFVSNQAERRRIHLSEQKKKRHEKIELLRLKPTTSKKTTSPSKRSLVNPLYANQLMFSEWLVEVPYDLDKNWIMILCPIGKRCLVVASEGTTSVYNKAGKLISKHISKLPGGSRDSKIDYTILDCVYSDPLRTYFVLDCLCWKSHPIVDSETDFRFYWLKCKLDESNEVTNFSYENPYVFKDLPRVSGLTADVIRNQFNTRFEFELDGVLFYHKETHYEPGCTPLVGWLKPYMIPEILNISMPEWILNQAPSDYINVRNSIEKFEFEQRNKYEDKMECAIDNKESNFKNVDYEIDFKETTRLEM